MSKFTWGRSETLALANHQCSYCHGMGLTTGKRGKESPCNCVFRSIFRACLERFQHCASKEKYVSQVTMQLVSSGRSSSGRRVWGRRDEEFQADFVLVSRRHLDETENSIFKFHFLLGADWKMCCKRLGMDRGEFFHTVYRIQQKLGRVFRELQPYALFPLDEYFSSAPRSEAVPIMPRNHSFGPIPLRPPVHEFREEEFADFAEVEPLALPTAA